MSFRVVGGSLRGRRFRPHVGEHTRPTSERVREALASALVARGLIEGARVLELFAGTGALSFEALSRGAQNAVLVERDRRALAGLRDSVAALGLADRVTLRPHDLGRDLARAETITKIAADGPFDLVFADPPYANAEALPALVRALARAGAFASGATLVLEHPKATDLSGLAPFATYEYGDTAVAFVGADGLG